MTPAEVKQLFEDIIDDSFDETSTYLLMQAAYTKRNESRPWRFLLKLDTSLSAISSDTWETQKSLPTDFGRDHKLFVGSGISDEYLPIPFERMIQYKSTARRYTIDMLNLKLRLMGTVSASKTIYLFYFYVPTTIDVSVKDSATVIVWPGRFHPLLAFDMAALYFAGIDADDTTRQMSPAHRLAAKELSDAMTAWDNKLWLRAMDHSSAPQTRSNDLPDVVN